MSIPILSTSPEELVRFANRVGKLSHPGIFWPKHALEILATEGVIGEIDYELMAISVRYDIAAKKHYEAIKIAQNAAERETHALAERIAAKVRPTSKAPS